VAAEDDEGEVHDDIGSRHQLVDGRAVEDVPLDVGGAAPAEVRRLERPARHSPDLADVLRALERPDEGLADLAGGAGHGDLELALSLGGRHHPPPGTSAGSSSCSRKNETIGPT
jgi:hypothetical protein